MPREHRYYVYLLTNRNDKVMYVGVTNNLERRVHEHKTKMVPGFTEKCNVNKLVYFEETNDVRAAIAREKEIKKWRREKKNNLVVAVNPEWKDLSDGWFEISPFGRDDNGSVSSACLIMRDRVAQERRPARRVREVEGLLIKSQK